MGGLLCSLSRGILQVFTNTPPRVNHHAIESMPEPKAGIHPTGHPLIHFPLDNPLLIELNAVCDIPHTTGCTPFQAIRSEDFEPLGAVGMKDLVPITRSKSLKEQAYEILKGMILTGGLEQDKLHNEKRVAEALGVSRTPVREALLELSREGMILFLPGKGFQVRKFTLQEIQEVFDVRRIIEGHVIRAISQRLTEEDHDQIERLITKLQKLAGRKKGK